MPTRHYYVVDGESSLSINGSANVVNYHCAATHHSWGDTLMVASINDSLCAFSQNILTVPVLAFECDNPVMTKDFRGTLQAEKFPEIELAVNELIFRCDNDVETVLNGTLRLCERLQKLQVNCSKKNIEKGFYIRGHHSLRFSDFGIEPPEKLLGLVKVEDELVINFQLLLREH